MVSTIISGVVITDLFAKRFKTDKEFVDSLVYEIKWEGHGHLDDACDYKIGEYRVVCITRDHLYSGEGGGFNINPIVEI